jgi:hypothetical protein
MVGLSAAPEIKTKSTAKINRAPFFTTHVKCELLIIQQPKQLHKQKIRDVQYNQRSAAAA